MATLAPIGGAIRDKVGINIVLEHRLSVWRCVKGDTSTYLVPARVYSEVRCKRDGSAEEEQSVERINTDHSHRMAGQSFSYGRGNKVDERQHAENRDEHGIIDDRGVAGVCFCDHVADQRDNEKSPQELRSGSVLLIRMTAIICDKPGGL